MIPFFVIFLFVFSSCHRTRLDVIHKTVSKSDLASTYVKSPDPRQMDMQEGEQLLISWNIPAKVFRPPCILELAVIFKDKSEEKILKKISSKSGLFSYDILGYRMKHSHGIYSYQVKIVDASQQEITCLREKMWVHILRLGIENELKNRERLE